MSSSLRYFAIMAILAVLLLELVSATAVPQAHRPAKRQNRFRRAKSEHTEVIVRYTSRLPNIPYSILLEQASASHKDRHRESLLSDGRQWGVDLS